MATSEKEVDDTQHVDRKCGLDMSYVKSINGILKAKQIGWSLLPLLACIAGNGVAIVFFIIATLCGWTTSGWSLLAFTLACTAGSGVSIIFFIIATLCGWTTTFVIWFMFASHTYKKVTKVNWFLADLLVSLAACVLYVAIGIPVVISPFCPVCIAAGVFGFVAVASYGAGMWYSFKRWRESKKRSSTDNQYAVDY